MIDIYVDRYFFLLLAIHLWPPHSCSGLKISHVDPGKMPRSVCFPSRKLQGTQYPYDVRSVEVLAVRQGSDDPVYLEHVLVR